MTTEDTLQAKAHRFAMSLPATITIILTIFICATLFHTGHSSHFISDDLQHFSDIGKKSFFEFLITPIDIHFAPLHRLLTYIIFKAFPLKFSVALAVMAFAWITLQLLLYRILIKFCSSQSVWIILLLIGASPLWIHNFLWWSSAAHRLPYLALQAASILFYLQYREHKSFSNGVLSAAMQVIALGFYVKAIFFPVVIVSLEFCLAIKNRSMSREALRIILGMAAISVVYGTWYILFAPVMKAPIGTGLVTAVVGALELISRAGRLLIFAPIDQSWGFWISSAFWSALIGLHVWRKPWSLLPIGALLLLLASSYALTISGRAGLMLYYPTAAMRYYADDMVVIAVFFALAVSSPERLASVKRAPFVPSNLFALTIAFTYPTLSYFSQTYITGKFYPEHISTHKYMINLERALEHAQEKKDRIEILKTDFPEFVFGFMGMRLGIKDVMQQVYPYVDWIDPIDARGEIAHINQRGRIGPANLSITPDFRDDLSFPSWYPPELSHRWSRENRATILFTVYDNQFLTGLLTINGPVIRKQKVIAKLNGTDIGVLDLAQSDNCCKWSIPFDSTLIIRGINAFEFILPDAQQPGNGDPRVVSIGVSSIEIQ